VSVVVLICDDDPEDRTALRHALDGFDVTETPHAGARAVLEKKSFDAIVGDDLELMHYVRTMYPATVRFLVSGDEIEHLNAALNEGAVHRYFAKPHDAERLRTQLEKSLRDRTLRIPRFTDAK
jgi:CheY-like chemotaxis protein